MVTDGSQWVVYSFDYLVMKGPTALVLFGNVIPMFS